MPPPTTDPGSPPASPAPLASTLLASFQRMTSSARILLIGCFQCGFLKAGCWRQQEEHDGAWFDCEKLQVEHPYCYVNPVALADAPSTTALCHAPTSEDATPTPPHTTHPGAPPLKASPQRSPGSSLAPRGTSMPPGAPPPKHQKKSYVNGGLISEGTVQCEAGDSTCTVESSVSMGLKDGVARYVRGHSGRTSLVESFAAKLEADLRRLECDRQRAEGEIVALDPTADDSDWLTEYSGTKSCNSDFLLDPPSGYPYDELEDPPPLRPDVWKPSELENVFECYNMAAFYSYGATCQVGEKFAGSRVRGEKFEEVFPVSPHSNNNNNNNNNNYKVLHKASSEGEQNSSTHRITCKDKLTTETAPSEPPAGDGRQRECSEDQLRQLIQACVFAESISEVDEEMCILSNKDVHRKDNLLADSTSEVGKKIGTRINQGIRRNNSGVTGNVSEVSEKDCSVIYKDVHRKANLSAGDVSDGEKNCSVINKDVHRKATLSAGDVSDVGEKNCSAIYKDVHRKAILSAGDVSDVGEKNCSVIDKDVHRKATLSAGNVSEVGEKYCSVIDKGIHRKAALSARAVSAVNEKQCLINDRDIHRNNGMFVGNVNDVDEKQCLVSDQDTHRNNATIRFGGKSFNKLLVFDLVKSAMSECSEQYPRSMTLCSTYPVHLVQTKVMKVMLDEDKKSEENLCGLEVFHSPSLSTQRERHVARRLVVGVATDEVKAEDKHWQDFRREEQEVKDAIVSEVLHDLISDTADIFKLLVAKKLAANQGPED